MREAGRGGASSYCEAEGFTLSVDVCQGSPGPGSWEIRCQLHFETGRVLSLSRSLFPCSSSPASLTDSDRLSYQNMGLGPHGDWLGRTILGLENSCLRKTIIRHFKSRELNATHSWQFLFMTSNNCLRCKGRGGGRLSEFILGGCSMHRVGLWAEEDELGGVRLTQSGAGGAPCGGPQP